MRVLPITVHLFSGEWTARSWCCISVAETRTDPEKAARALARRILRINHRHVKVRSASAYKAWEPCIARRHFVAIST